MLKGIVFAFIAAFAAADAAGGTVGNAFVEVSAERVKRLDGRDFRVFGNGVRISPNPGWRLVSPEFPRFDGNSPAIYRAVDFSGESEATGVVHIVTTETVDRHVEKPRLALRVDGGGLYALPSGSASTNIVVSFTAETGSTGTHEEVVRIFEDGELLSETVRAYETDFDRWMWGEASGHEGSGASAGNVFTFACNLPPGDYTIAQSVSAVWTGCRGVECEDSAETNCNVSVRRLDLGCGAWIGLDRTGDPSAAYVSPAVVATARLLPEGTASGATWNYSGVCEKRSIEPWSLKLWTENRENASSAYLSERIEAEAGGVSSVTNFTVVKVDVTIDDVQSETKEEIDGAFVVYAPDEEDGTIGEEGLDRMVDVSFSCTPANLPPGEMVEISHSGPGELYEVRPGGVLSRIDSAALYRASEIASKSFKLHGHESSSLIKDGLVSIRHPSSGAVDEAKYTCLKFEFVTPAGDPVNSPVDSGRGQNEFTYSMLNPGIINMRLEVLVQPSGVAAAIVGKCRFQVQEIGESLLSWATSNPNGIAHFAGDILSANVVFTGLPEHNSAFGRKTAVFSFNDRIFITQDYEVFFPKTGRNHPPCTRCRNCPNWFYYWKDGNVCSIPQDAKYEQRQSGYGYWRPETGLVLYDMAAYEDTSFEIASCVMITNVEFEIARRFSMLANVNSNSVGIANHEYYVTNRTVSVDVRHVQALLGGDGKGIGCVAMTVVHELEHASAHARMEAGENLISINLELVSKREDEFGYDSLEAAAARLLLYESIRMNGDCDKSRYSGDGVVDSFERDLSQVIVSATDNCDTFNLSGLLGVQDYADYGDEEARCRFLETRDLSPYYNELIDWADPGCQNKNKFGPRRDER